MLPMGSDCSGVVLGRLAMDLLAIQQAKVSLASWQRRLPEPLSAWLDALPDERLPQLGAQGRHEELAHAIHGALAPLRQTHPAPTELLCQDILRQVALFCTVAQAPSLRLRLERIDHDGCRKWHQDWTSLRLLCTYRG
jgi:hypothetical protein